MPICSSLNRIKKQRKLENVQIQTLLYTSYNAGVFAAPCDLLPRIALSHLQNTMNNAKKNPDEMFQLDWGLVWPVQAWQLGPRWQEIWRRRGVAERRGWFSETSFLWLGHSLLSFSLSVFLLIHLSSDSLPVLGLHSNLPAFCFPTHSSP